MNYRINLPRVAHETLDNETIIIDFDKGTYYSLSGTAYRIWSLIEQGSSVEAIIDQITACYSGEEEKIEAAVRQFLGKLVQAEMIVETNGALSVVPFPAVVHKEPFTPPLLEEYTDIQDLLLLDPIHEVGKHGWPMRKA